MRRLEKLIISRAWIGLFHGMDCFEAYHRWSKRPFVTHNIALEKENAITEAILNSRLSTNVSTKLQFVYAGRVHVDKGVFDWIEVFTRLNNLGLDFSAVWFGDGPQRDDAIRMVAARKLESKVSFPGALDQLEVIESLKRSDAFVFCHKTKESPRCLIEALLCGLPLVGYGSDYSQDLIKENSGGMLSPPGDVLELVNSLVTISDRPTLRKVSERAFRDARRFTIEHIFQSRAQLMKMIPKEFLRETAVGRSFYFRGRQRPMLDSGLSPLPPCSRQSSRAG
jgi:glycosyltransferase involved in cell wall biosynthesis